MADEKVTKVVDNSVSVEAPKVERSFKTEYDFGANLQEAVEAFGEDVVHSLYAAKALIVLQDNIRRMLEKGKTDDEIAAFVAGWKPGVVAVRSGEKKKEKILSDFEKMTDAQKLAMIEELQARLAKSADEDGSGE